MCSVFRPVCIDLHVNSHGLRTAFRICDSLNTGDVVEDFKVMARSLLWSELWQTHSREALVLP